MIKLWRNILRPVADAAGVRHILEIGAEYGTSTAVLLKYVRSRDGVLHCIDPYPAFEAGELLRDNPDHLRFYRNLSLDIISELPRVDLAMVDGDHNWFTVYNELVALEALHGSDPLQQPLYFVHDIGWPYGRRDLYYNPETIPAEHRQAHARRGILPNSRELVDNGGMNRTLDNALLEGGPRNGVLTGVEDFIEQSAIQWRFLNLPLYYGLGILVAEARLEASAALRAQIDALSLSDGAERLLRQAEHIRCVDGVMMQAINHRLVAAEERVRELERELAEVRQGGADRV